MNRQLLALSLLVAALLSLGWWVRQLTTPEERQRQVSDESPTAIAETLTVHRYDVTGRLQQTLITPHMEHYESRDTSELAEPVLWRFSSDAPPWRMQAEQALADNRTETVYLPGEVIIERDADPRNAAYRIVTSDLTLETATSHATTDRPVLITSDEQRITAIGMEGWLNSPIKLNLLHQVRGYYVFD